MNALRRGLVLLVSLLALAFPASAQTLDPQLFICNGCSSPAGGDPNIVNPTNNLDIGVAGAGQQTQNPVILIVGVYDGTGSTATPTVTYGSGNVAASLGGVGDWGETTDHVEMLSGTDAYNDVGFADLNGGNSETFAKWSGADVSKLGLAAATSFELFAFVLNESLVGNTANPITISGAAEGSFAIAYSCELGGPTAASGTGCTDGNVDSTPFTNAALLNPLGVTPVPEPASMALLGTGLLGAFGLLRRKL